MKMYGNHFDEAKARSIRDVARQEEGGSRAGTSAVFASMMEPGKAPTALMLEQNKPYNRPLESDTLHKSMDAGDESLKAQASQMEYDPRGEYAAQIRTGIMASPAYDRMAQEVAKANGEDPKAVRLRMNKNLETASPATMKAVANQVGVDLDQYVKRATGRGEEARGTLTSEMASKEMLEVIKNAASIPAMLHPESEASRALQGAAEEGLSLPPGTLKSMNGITILHSKMMEAPVVQLRVKAIMQNFDTAAKTAAPVAPGVTKPTTMVQTQLRGVGILSVPPNSEQAVAGVTDNTNKIEIVRREAQAIMEMERRYSRGGQVASSVFGADKWQEYTDHARQLKAAADSLGNPQLTKAVGELTSLTTSGAAGDVRASMLQNRDRAAAQALALAEQKYQGLLNPLIVKPTISETDRASGIIPKAIPRQYDIGKDGRLYSQFRMDSGNVVYGYRDPASGNYVKWYKSIR
jgi:hypothetical protein